MPEERMTLRKAAVQLGVSEGVIRKRVARGTICYEMGTGGLQYVWVDAGDDGGTDASYTTATDRDALVDVLKEQVTDLRARLDWEQEANREIRRRIAALTSRIPELESPTQQDATQDATDQATATPNNTSAAPTQEPEASQEERRSWWRRWFQS